MRLFLTVDDRRVFLMETLLRSIPTVHIENCRAYALVIRSLTRCCYLKISAYALSAFLQ